MVKLAFPFLVIVYFSWPLGCFRTDFSFSCVMGVFAHLSHAKHVKSPVVRSEKYCYLNLLAPSISLDDDAGSMNSGFFLSYGSLHNPHFPLFLSLWYHPKQTFLGVRHAFRPPERLLLNSFPIVRKYLLELTCRLSEN